VRSTYGCFGRNIISGNMAFIAIWQQIIFESDDIWEISVPVVFYGTKTNVACFCQK